MKIEVTPEMRQRAVEFLADRLLYVARDIEVASMNILQAREIRGLPHNPAREIERVAASMAIALAREMLEGKIIPLPVIPLESKKGKKSSAE